MDKYTWIIWQCQLCQTRHMNDLKSRISNNFVEDSSFQPRKRRRGINDEEDKGSSSLLQRIYFSAPSTDTIIDDEDKEGIGTSLKDRIGGIMAVETPKVNPPALTASKLTF